MSNLSIRKKSLNTWLHTDSIFGDFIISKFYFNSFFAKFQIVEEGNTRLEKYEIANITLYDDTNGGTTETFSTITELSLRLEALQYPAFDRTGTTIFPSMEQITNVNVTDIEDNQVLAWDVATSKWVNITIGGLTTPTLQDVLMQGGREVFKIDDAEETYITTEEDKGKIIFIPPTANFFTSIIIDDVYEIGDTLLIYNEPGGHEIALLSGSFIPDYTTSLNSNVGELISITLIGNDGTQNLYTYNVMPYQVHAGASWGSIIGTLADQTDLQTALNGKKNIDVVISSNTTASNDRNYSVVANATFTDPTPAEGKGYMVTVINGAATIGGVGYTVGQKVFRHYHSGSWRTFVYLDKSIIDTLLANKIDYLIRDFTFSSVTGVTTETLVESYEITAGKIGLNDFLNGFIYTTRTGLANAYTVTLKANTVNNSSTATTIASVATLGNFAPLTPMKFELTVKAGVIIGTTIDQQQGTNYRGQSSAINVPFDNSVNSVYLFLFVTPTNTSSVVQVQSFKLTK